MNLIDAQNATLSLRVKRSALTHIQCTKTHPANRCMFCIFTTCLLPVSVQAPVWSPLLVLFWSFCVAPLLHQGPVYLRGSLILPSLLSPLPRRDNQGHHFPSRQRGVLRGDGQRCGHTVAHAATSTPHASSRTLTCSLWQPRGGGDIRDERVRDGDYSHTPCCFYPC